MYNILLLKINMYTNVSCMLNLNDHFCVFYMLQESIIFAIENLVDG